MTRQTGLTPGGLISSLLYRLGPRKLLRCLGLASALFGAAGSAGAVDVRIGELTRTTRDLSCGAGLIAEDLVVTAAHCLYRTAGATPDIDSLMLVFPESDGTLTRHRIARAMVPRGYVRKADPQSLAHVGRDLAILRLASPADGPTTPVLQRNPYSGRAGFFHLSQDGLVPFRSCPLARLPEGPLVLECATRPGMSGFPVFVIEQNVARVIGVIAAGGRGPDGLVTMVAPATPALSWIDPHAGDVHDAQVFDAQDIAPDADLPARE